MKDVIDGAKTEVETFHPYMLTHANLTPQVISLKCDKYSASVHDCFYNLECICVEISLFFAVFGLLSLLSCSQC